MDARLDDAGRDQRHDGDERLHQHAAIADEAGIPLTVDQFWGGAGRDQAVETRDRAAGDGDEQEREQRARPDGPSAVHEPRHRWHLEVWRNEQNAEREGSNRSDLEKGREIVARGQEQPHWQDRGDETVGNQHPAELCARKGKGGTPGRALGDVLAEHDRQHQEHETNGGNLADGPGPDVTGVEAHEDRNRDRRRDRERAPRALGQGLDDNERQHGQDDDHDHERAEQRDDARHRPEFGADQLTERAPIAAHGDEQDHEVLHRPGEHDASQDPHHARQVAHLRREDRPDERPRPGNGRKVVAIEHVLVGGNVVEPVVVAHRRCGPRRVELHHVPGDVEGVVAVGDQVDGDGRDHDPQSVDMFAASSGDDCERDRAQDADENPGAM
jgi:hypothetical protein